MNDLAQVMLSPAKENKAKNEKEIVEFLKMLKGKIEKLPNKLLFHSVANDKLIHVTDEKGNDVIKTKANNEDGVFNIPIYVAKIKGKWTLAR